MIVDLFLMLRCYAYTRVLAVLLFVTAATATMNNLFTLYIKHNGMSSIKEMLNIHSLFKSTIFFDDKTQVT